MIRLTRNAYADLTRIISYVEARNAQAAIELRQRFTSEFTRLEKYPELGRVGRVAGTRERLISATPYIVAYRSDGGDVQILAVRHSRRLWPVRFKE